MRTMRTSIFWQICGHVNQFNMEILASWNLKPAELGIPMSINGVGSLTTICNFKQQNCKFYGRCGHANMLQPAHMSFLAAFWREF